MPWFVQEKLDKLKSKQQLMSKERLMQGAPTQVRGEPQESLFDTSVQESLSRAGGMRYHTPWAKCGGAAEVKLQAHLAKYASS